NYIVKQVIKTKPSMRKLRALIKDQQRLSNPRQNYLKVIDEMVVSTRNCMINYDISINKLEPAGMYYSRALSYRYKLHQLLDEIINERASIKSELEQTGDFE
ncbi:MAG: hypothetical protein ACP5TZ_05825, partial [Nitrososphaeria archaeon]